MKSIFYLVAIMLLVSGCSYKNEAINLESYKAQYTGPIAKEKKSVYVKVVQDIRKDKRSIGYTQNDGEKMTTLYSEVDFVKRYKKGLGYAFNIAGFDTETKNASLVIEVNIKKIELVYNNKNFDTNLKGTLIVEVIIQKGNKTITHNFRQQASKWIKPSFKSKDLEPFLYTLFVDNINDIVSKLTEY